MHTHQQCNVAERLLSSIAARRVREVGIGIAGRSTRSVSGQNLNLFLCILVTWSNAATAVATISNSSINNCLQPQWR